MDVKEIIKKRSDLRLAIVRLLQNFERETDIEIASVKVKHDEGEQWEVDVKLELEG